MERFCDRDCAGAFEYVQTHGALIQCSEVGCTNTFRTVGGVKRVCGRCMPRAEKRVECSACSRRVQRRSGEKGTEFCSHGCFVGAHPEVAMAPSLAELMMA